MAAKRESENNHITIDVEVNSDLAIKKMKKIQRELKETIRLFKELDAVSTKGKESEYQPIRASQFTHGVR